MKLYIGIKQIITNQLGSWADVTCAYQDPEVAKVMCQGKQVIEIEMEMPE